jgi:hypothetical protein
MEGVEMEIEIVIAELMKVFGVEKLTPEQYQEAVLILLELEKPIAPEIQVHP